MTREEARVLLKNLNNQVTSAFYDGDFWVEEGTFEAFEVADAALRGLDPDTGLVPCDYCTDTFDARKTRNCRNSFKKFQTVKSKTRRKRKF